MFRRHLTITQRPSMTQPIRHSHRHRPIATMSNQKSILTVFSPLSGRLLQKTGSRDLARRRCIDNRGEMWGGFSSPHAIAGDLDPFPTLSRYNRWTVQVWIVSGSVNVCARTPATREHRDIYVSRVLGTRESVPACFARLRPSCLA